MTAPFSCVQTMRPPQIVVACLVHLYRHQIACRQLREAFFDIEVAVDLGRIGDEVRLTGQQASGGEH